MVQRDISIQLLVDESDNRLQRASGVTRADAADYEDGAIVPSSSWLPARARELAEAGDDFTCIGRTVHLLKIPDELLMGFYDLGVPAITTRLAFNNAICDSAVLEEIS